MPQHHKPDNIFASPIAKLGDFSFDQQVADVFPDMIKRSVPGYSNIISTIGMLTKRFAQANSNLYDLGCALGAASLEMRRNVEVSGCEIIAIDNSPAMIEGCQRHLNGYKSDTKVSITCGDICTMNIENASVVVINFTLQFISPKERDVIIQTIYDAMLPGGLLLLSEKLKFDDERSGQLLTDLHLDFKRANGYSELEISQKRSAIEDVLLPDTLDEHKTRLTKAGFSCVELWFQCFNFSSLIAIK